MTELQPWDPAALAAALETLDDAGLGVVLEAATAELRRRAVAQGDLGAIIDTGFERGFDRAGVARAPYLEGLVLVCPGSKLASSALAHKCRFVAVGDAWVWEADALLADEIRPRDRHSTQSISLVVATEGLEFEVVSSRARSGTHERIAAEAYRIVDGRVVSLGVRAGRALEHR